MRFITIEDKDLLFNKLFGIQNFLSEYSFSNLYLFREAHEYKIIESNNHIFLSGITYDKEKYLMPLEDLSKCSKEYFNELVSNLSGYDMIFPVPEDWLHLFPSEKFSISHNEDDADYIFEIDKLRTYPGRKLHSKKNLLNQFVKNYNASIELFNEDNIDNALKILDIWQEESGSDAGETDYKPCIDAINNFRDLRLCGALFKADGKYAGFVIGEEISSDCYGIHFAKGIKEFKGIYQYMFSRCSEIHIEKYRFINLEQDMGKENLRVAKSSYMPDLMAKKYRVKLVN